MMLSDAAVSWLIQTFKGGFLCLTLFRRMAALTLMASSSSVGTCGHFVLFLEDTKCNPCRRHCPCTICTSLSCCTFLEVLSKHVMSLSLDGETKLAGRTRTSSTGSVSLLQWLHALLHTPGKMTICHRQTDRWIDEGGRREERTHLKILSGACSPVTRS